MNKNILRKTDFNEWQIYKPQRVRVIAADLAKAIETDDFDKIIEIIKDMRVLRSLVVLRGEKGEYLKLIVFGFEKIISKKEGLSISRESGETILNCLLELNIPEEVLFFCGDMAYHFRDKDKLDIFLGIIFDNKDLLFDKKVYFRALHTLASWSEVFLHNSEESIRLNMEVIANTKETDPVFYTKAKFGLSYNKILTPKQKVKDFLSLSEDFKKYGNLYDSFRATTEAARAMLDLAKQQGIDAIAFENLEASKKIALDSLKMAKDIGYVNLEIVACEALSLIYVERLKKLETMKQKIENFKEIPRDYVNKYKTLVKIFKRDASKSGSYKKRVRELRAIYNYNTQFSNQYKESYYKHV